jgi:hypothetical protein
MPKLEDEDRMRRKQLLEQKKAALESRVKGIFAGIGRDFRK